MCSAQCCCSSKGKLVGLAWRDLAYTPYCQARQDRGCRLPQQNKEAVHVTSLHDCREDFRAVAYKDMKFNYEVGDQCSQGNDGRPLGLFGCASSAIGP